MRIKDEQRMQIRYDCICTERSYENEKAITHEDGGYEVATTLPTNFSINTEINLATKYMQMSSTTLSTTILLKLNDLCDHQLHRKRRNDPKKYVVEKFGTYILYVQ